MNYMLSKKDTKIKKAVVLTDSVYHSYLGRYFFGQTDIMTFGNSHNAWGALVNPKDSKVNMFLNAYTISNFSDVPLTVEGFLSSTLPGEAETSKFVAAGNQAIIPVPTPKVQIQSASMVESSPVGGTYTFVRRVEPNTTLTKHDFQGMYIIPPGSSFALYFVSPVKNTVKARIAFGWWEDRAV